MSKREARVLASKCFDTVCCGYVVRGSGVDGFSIGCRCEGLCRRLGEKGFMGELRYYVGECNCNLPEAPSHLAKTAEAYSRLAETVCKSLVEALGLLPNFLPPCRATTL